MLLMEQSNKLASFPVQLNPTSEATPSLLKTDGSRASTPVGINIIYVDAWLWNAVSQIIFYGFVSQHNFSMLH